MLGKKLTLSKQRGFWARYKIKIFSVLFAILIWLLIVTGGAFHYTCVFPISLPSNPDYAIINELPKNLHVRVQGKGSNLLTTLLFNEGRYEPKINWEEGTYSIPVLEKDILLSGNSKQLSINQIIDPDSLKIVIEKLVTKRVPISGTFSIKASPGYIIVGKPSLIPDSVTIKGPRSFVTPIDSILTKEITFTDIKRPMNQTAELEINDSQMIQISRKNTIVKADIQKIMQKEIVNVPVRAQNIPYNMRPIVLPARINLIVQGGVNIISPLTADSFYVYLDYLEPTKENEHSFAPQFNGPSEVIISHFKPERFKIVLEKD